jgi:hypothetical protein
MHILLTQVGDHSGVTTAAFTLFNDLVPPTAIDAVWKSAAAWGAEGFGDYGVFVCVFLCFPFYFSFSFVRSFVHSSSSSYYNYSTFDVFCGGVPSSHCHFMLEPSFILHKLNINLNPFDGRVISGSQTGGTCVRRCHHRRHHHQLPTIKRPLIIQRVDYVCW